MKKIECLKGIPQLVDAIGTGCSPDAKGPVVLKYKLWDGRIVTASYNRENKDADDHFDETVVFDEERLNVLAAKLLSGESFVIDTGTDDQFCSLEWAIRAAE